ncbi:MULTISPECIES: hypothetical protein [Actinomadura]|uniref:Alkaline phosphatase-like protein PglZ C-terminal domain-containing protein n=1 Tax=Actinomadura yumaensis TaxID=111807 RepID=A0ABW2CLY4_9ACTN|nr:hypothetical protein [Actinomadura sp. J1-007]MWK37061.1 hypothetical protein [Actinomadura sp. J1-007]
MLIPHALDRLRSSLLLADDPLGEGGQGVVRRVDGTEGLVYKEYLRNAGSPFAPALADIVEFGRKLPDISGQTLLQQSAWPLARVVHQGAVTGFLMHEIPAEFTAPIGGKQRPIELQYLLYKPNHTWSSLRLPDGTGRVQIAMAAVGLVDLLHSHGFVLGDISFRNLLWSRSRPYRIFMLDCDGVRRHGGEPVLPQAQTPEWEDPHLPRTGLDLDTDRYKLALLVGRVLSRHAYVRPGQNLDLVEGIDPHTANAVTRLFDGAAQAHGFRPTAQEWLQALEGRKWIAVKRPPVRVEQPLPTPRTPLMTASRQRSYYSVSMPGDTGTLPAASGGSSVSTRKPASSSSAARPRTGPRPDSAPAVGNGASQPVAAQVPPQAPSTEPTKARLGEQVVGSASFADQQQLVRNCRLDKNQIADLIDLLVETGGRGPVTEVARLLNEPLGRSVMVLGSVCQLLNLDGEQVLVLRDDDQTLELNIPLLEDQFLEAAP